MKKYFFITIISLLLPYFVVFGQISTMEEPMSFRTDIPALARSNVPVLYLPSLDMERIMQEDIEDEKLGMPPRFGYKFRVSYNLENSGEWLTLPDGGRIWRLSLSSPGALSINLLYDKFWLPDGAKLWIYSSDRRHSIGAFTSFNNIGGKYDVRGFATGLVFGDQITIEYYVPNNQKEVGIISIAYVVHGYRHIRSPDSFDSFRFDDLESCQVNINCIEGQNWQNEKNAVAMILVGGYRECTGALINNTANDKRPLFLTAFHCLSERIDAVINPNLDHWSFWWHYESPYCEDAVPVIRSTVGAAAVAYCPTTDFALLLLTEDPRDAPGVTPYYLGWDITPNPGRGGVSIHHPLGNIKKIATHDIYPRNSVCMDVTIDGIFMCNSKFWMINWMATPNGHSIPAPGSSGAPLLNNYGRVIGQLQGPGSCPSINCHNPSRALSNFGKLRYSWLGITGGRLGEWLDPLDKGVSTWGSCGMCTFSNRLVIIDETITGCYSLEVENVIIIFGATLTLIAPGNIYISNITIAENSRLILYAGGDIIIDGYLDVHLGGEFEIK